MLLSPADIITDKTISLNQKLSMDAAVRLLWQYLQDYANLLNWCVSIFLVYVLATKVDNEFEKLGLIRFQDCFI